MPLIREQADVRMLLLHLVITGRRKIAKRAALDVEEIEEKSGKSDLDRQLPFLSA